MSKFTFRFGTLKSTDIKQSGTGREYARFAIDAGSFTAYGVTFDPTLIKTLAETQDGEKIRAGGFIDSKTVQVEGGERTYLTLITRMLKIGDAEAVHAEKANPTAAQEAAVDDEVTPDDLTAIKGIGPKAALRLQELGYLTFADLAAADVAQQAVLDDEIPSVKGNLSRYDVFGQASQLAVA